MRRRLGGGAELGLAVLWAVLAIVATCGDAGAGPNENKVVVLPFAQNVAGFQSDHFLINTGAVAAAGARFCFDPSGGAAVPPTTFTVLPNTMLELPATDLSGTGICIYDSSVPISASVLAGIPGSAGLLGPGTQFLVGTPGVATVMKGHGGSYWWTGPGWNTFLLASNPTNAQVTLNVFQFSPDASLVNPVQLNLGPGQSGLIQYPSLGGTRGAVEFNVTGAGGVTGWHVFLGAGQAILKEISGDAFNEVILSGGAYE